VPEPQEITAATANCDAVKVREIVRLIEDDGWYQVRQRGTHRQFKHVTVPGKPGDDLHPKTRASILRQAGLTP
jgi:predicted RNA binding protein YcfA (HicA-like mRNA interferase family)